MTIYCLNLFLGTVALASLVMTSGGRAASALDEALDIDVQGIDSSSSAPAWARDTTEHNDGEDAAVSPAITHDQSAEFQITVQGPDTVSYWWKVSSEDDYDVLRLLMDGEVTLEISGEADWTSQTLVIPPGPHILRWEYAKDDSFSEGLDRAWVDEVRFASASVPTVTYPNLVGAYIGETVDLLPSVTGDVESYGFAGTLPPGVQFDPKSGRVFGPYSAIGQFSFSVTAQNNNGSSPPVPIVIEVAPQPQDIVASLALGWQWAGRAAWQSQTERNHDGTAALRSGDLSDNESSELLLPLIGPAAVRFWWRVDSEGGHDPLSFLVDGAVALDTDGQPTQIDDLVEWEQRTVVIPDGPHTISWRYQKDAAGFEGEDAAWLDEIEIIDTRDPDNDGVPSLAEVFVGSDWKVPDPSPISLPTIAGARLSWQLLKATDIEGIRPAAEISYDLENWSAAPLETLVDDEFNLVVREREPTPAKGKFVRLSFGTEVPE